MGKNKMIKLLDILKEIEHPKQEKLRHYGGRYMFDVTAAYKLVGDKDIKEFDPTLLKQFSHPLFSTVDPVKLKRIKKEIDYTRPLGLLVKFRDPESEKTEWVLIDGNHRVRAAAEANQKAKLYVISDPDKVATIMDVDTSKPHSLIPDEDDE
jgi:hypothetical protein